MNGAKEKKEKKGLLGFNISVNVTLSAKTSLMHPLHKAGFRREGHKSRQFQIIDCTTSYTIPYSGMETTQGGVVVFKDK